MATPIQSSPTATAYSIDEKYLAARLEGVEARTDTKFERLIGKIDALAASVAALGAQVKDAKDAAGSVRPYVIATGLAIGGFVVGIFAFGAQILDVALTLAGKK